MKGRIICWIVCLLAGMPEMAAQWECIVKNSLEPRANTRLYLKYDAPSNNPREFRADIRFRQRGSISNLLRKEETLRTAQATTFSIPINLPPGEYEVEIDIVEPELQVHNSLQPEAFYQVNDHKIPLSDIYFSQVQDPLQAFASPITHAVMPPGLGRIYYFLKLGASERERLLTVRAYLFKDQDTTQLSRGTIKAYESLQQTNDVIEVKPGASAWFSDQLDLSVLKQGGYLLSIEIYEENTPLARETVNFRVGGDLRQTILEELDNSIRQMEYVLPLTVLEDLLSYDDSLVQEGAFLRAWEDLYGEEAEDQMLAYFRRVYQASERYEEQESGWQTDRGKTFIKYGTPQTESLEINGKSFLRWTYPKWSLVFLFEKRNQGYYLVE